MTIDVEDASADAILIHIPVLIESPPDFSAQAYLWSKASGRQNSQILNTLEKSELLLHSQMIFVYSRPMNTTLVVKFKIH